MAKHTGLKRRRNRRLALELRAVQAEDQLQAARDGVQGLSKMNAKLQEELESNRSLRLRAETKVKDLQNDIKDLRKSMNDKSKKTVLEKERSPERRKRKRS